MAREVLYVCSCVIESHDVDWHASADQSAAVYLQSYYYDIFI